MDSVAPADKRLQLSCTSLKEWFCFYNYTQMVFCVAPLVSTGAAFVCSYSHVFGSQTICSDEQIFRVNRLDWITPWNNPFISQSVQLSSPSIESHPAGIRFPYPGRHCEASGACPMIRSLIMTQLKVSPEWSTAAESLKPASLPLPPSVTFSRFRVGSTTHFHLITVVKRTVRAEAN